MEPDWTINSIAKIAEGPRREVVKMLSAILTFFEGEGRALGFVPMLWVTLAGDTVHLRQIGERELLPGSPYYDEKHWPSSVIGDIAQLDQAAYPDYRASAWVRSRSGHVQSLFDAQRQGHTDAAIILMSHVECRTYLTRVPDVWFYCSREELMHHGRLVLQHDYRAVLEAGLRGDAT